ncbi:unnamed protein product [Amoebophrya sp. A120]|nr:unnamed protein product [Amoebophrya sp. A120]|eukprot:GSA120T00009173001.1
MTYFPLLPPSRNKLLPTFAVVFSRLGHILVSSLATSPLSDKDSSSTPRGVGKSSTAGIDTSVTSFHSPTKGTFSPASFVEQASEDEEQARPGRRVPTARLAMGEGDLLQQQQQGKERQQQMEPPSVSSPPATSAVANMVLLGVDEDYDYDYYQHYPKQYTARKLKSSSDSSKTPLIDRIDGDIDGKAEWNDDSTPWSDPFGDITGVNDLNDNDKAPPADCETRVKLLYDAKYLYVAAKLKYGRDNYSSHFHASYTTKNDPIYQQDSDFEVFVDVFGANQNYKELELNALNTVWNLMLNRPYSENGEEFSGRVTDPRENENDPRYWGVKDQKTAVKIVRGEVNQRNKDGAEWHVELALSWSDLLSRTGEEDVDAAKKGSAAPGSTNATSSGRAAPQGDMEVLNPREGHQSLPLPNHIRINFSRVEDKGDKNWVWSPQIAWNAKEQKFEGMINMHLPDAWGYLWLENDAVEGDDGVDVEKHEHSTTLAKAQDEENTSSKVTATPLITHNHPRLLSIPKHDPFFPARLIAMHLFYAQKAYWEQNQGYAPDLKTLIESHLTHPDPRFLGQGGELSASTFSEKNDENKAKFDIQIRLLGREDKSGEDDKHKSVNNDVDNYVNNDEKEKNPQGKFLITVVDRTKTSRSVAAAIVAEGTSRNLLEEGDEQRGEYQEGKLYNSRFLTVTVNEERLVRTGTRFLSSSNY